MSSTALVIPCFNEAHRFDAQYWTEISKIQAVHLVFVDDGSMDQTRALITEFAAKHSSEVLHHEVNLGKAEAIRTGLRHVLADKDHSIVGFLDADGAFPEDEVRRCIGLAQPLLQSKQCDAVWASRVALSGRKTARASFRHYAGRLIANLVSKGIEGCPHDSQCGFKLFDAANDLSPVLNQPFLTRWFVDIEIMLRWQSVSRIPLQIHEEPLRELNNQPGGSLSVNSVFLVMREVMAIRSLSKNLYKGRNRVRNPIS